MMTTIAKINLILNKKLKNYFIFIFIIIFATMILETLSLASFYPLLDIIFANSSTGEENFIKNFYLKFLSYLNIENDYKLNFTISLVGILFLLKISILLFCNWHSSNFEFAIRFFLTKKLYKTYLKKDYRSLIKYNSADIIKNIDHEINIFASGVSAIMTILTEGIIFIGILIFLFYFNPHVTLILLLFFTLTFFMLQFTYNKTLINWGLISQKFNKLRIKNFIESFNAIKEIKIFGKEKLFYESMDRFNKKFFNINRKEIFIRNVPKAFLEALLILIIIFYLIFFSTSFNDIQNQFAYIGIYLIAAYRILPSLNRVIVSFQRLSFSQVFIINISTQLKENLKDQITNRNFNLSDETIIIPKKHLALKNCSFFFNENNEKILNNVDIKFDLGKIYGIKGGSGAGKTTLLNIVSGLIYPSKGNLLIDDFPINKNNLKAFQKNVSYVPQNVFLFDTSIQKNINLLIDEEFENNKEDKKIRSLINSLSLDSKILKLEKGLDSIVGERGVNLSGGQIQRIGIARALYHEPKILILDEATNAIESSIESDVLDYLVSIKKDKIIILVAHRDSAFKKCDEIYELDSGKLTTKK